MQKRLGWKIALIIIILGLCGFLVYPLSEKINLGLDLQGGMHIVLEVETSELKEGVKLADIVDMALEIVRNRVDQFGVAEPSIQKQGENQIVVQLPGINDPDRAINLIGKTALLEFKLLGEEADLNKALKGDVPEGYVLSYLERRDRGDTVSMLLKEAAEVTGATLTNAMVRFDSQFGQPYVGLSFNPEGAKRFAEVTGANIDKQLAIVLDGKVKSAPVIRSKIPDGEAQISGNFTYEEAHDLAIVLRAGSLPAPVKIVENRTIGPSLGQDSVNKGIKACIIGACLVLLFMVVYYKYAGLLADICVIFNIVIILGVLSLFKATLTLPGIAGIILTIGIAVDANVLIFERIREELRAGKTARTAIATGYSRAFRAILDSNVTTLITTFILFQFGTGPIKGFAVTLSTGIIASFFTALFVSRVGFDLVMKRSQVTRVSI
ncbi:MAG: protein translocase subunit SecD [bacterium]|nr:protein translocase subunit SecD [bacterium]